MNDAPLHPPSEPRGLSLDLFDTTCPRCGNAAMIPLRKLFLGPLRSTPCLHCQSAVKVPVRSFAPCFVAMAVCLVLAEAIGDFGGTLLLFAAPVVGIAVYCRQVGRVPLVAASRQAAPG